MDVIQSKLNPQDAVFRENQAHMDGLVARLHERIALVKQGGGAAVVERHRGRGKLFVRDRIDRLTDPDSPLLELSPLAAWEMLRDEGGRGDRRRGGRLAGDHGNGSVLLKEQSS